MFTHLGNKCFRTRDVTLGKGFKERIGLLPKIVTKVKSQWVRIRTIPDYIHEYWLEKMYQEMTVNRDKNKDDTPRLDERAQTQQHVLL